MMPCCELLCNAVSRLLFLRATAATAVAHLNHRSSVCPSVCHTGGSVKNGMSEDHLIFTIGCLADASFRNRKAFLRKFEGGHSDRGR